MKSFKFQRNIMFLKKNKKVKISLIIILLLCIHFITFTIDSRLVSEAREPIFVLSISPAIKDGGSVIAYGLGYQVIRWHKIDGANRLFSYEIHRIPHFKKFEDGPDKGLKSVDYYQVNK